MSSFRHSLAVFARTHPFRIKTAGCPCIAIGFIIPVEEVVKAFGYSWPLIFSNRFKYFHAQFFINLLENPLCSGPDVLVFVAETVDQAFGIVSNICSLNSFLMDQDKMQHLKSPFFPPLKVGSKIGEDVFLANIISYSSKSINNFIAILLTFI